MYSGVPQTKPVRVSEGPPSAPPSTILAMPKSSTFTTSDSPPRLATTMMFSGLRSRWMTPAWCASARAESTWVTIRMMRGSGSGQSSVSTWWRSRPSTNSIAMKSAPSSVWPKSSTSMEFGWLSLLAAFASRWNRATVRGSFCSAGCSSFRTTGFSSTSWLAR